MFHRWFAYLLFRWLPKVDDNLYSFEDDEPIPFVLVDAA